jgi:Ca2+-dependent lipid-binding protein
VLEKGGKNPVWNDKLYFPLKHVEGDRVRLTVWDKETLKNDDMVGEGQFKPEETCTKCPIRYNGKAAGIIYIRVRLL